MAGKSIIIKIWNSFIFRWWYRLRCEEALPRAHIHLKPFCQIFGNVRPGDGDISQIWPRNVSGWMWWGLFKVSNVCFYFPRHLVAYLKSKYYVVLRGTFDNGWRLCEGNARYCISRDKADRQCRNRSKQGESIYRMQQIKRAHMSNQTRCLRRYELRSVLRERPYGNFATFRYVPTRSIKFSYCLCDFWLAYTLHRISPMGSFSSNSTPSLSKDSCMISLFARFQELVALMKGYWMRSVSRWVIYFHNKCLS